MKNDKVSKKITHNGEVKKTKHNYFLLVLFVLSFIVFGAYFVFSYITF